MDEDVSTKPMQSAPWGVRACVCLTAFGRLLRSMTLAFVVALCIACALVALAPAERACAGVTTGNWTVYYGSSTSSYSTTTVSSLQSVASYFESAHPFVMIKANQTSNDYDAGKYWWRAPANSTRVLTCSTGVSATYWSGAWQNALVELNKGSVLVVGERVTLQHTDNHYAVQCNDAAFVYLAGTLKSRSNTLYGKSGTSRLYRATGSVASNAGGNLTTTTMYRALITPGANIRTVSYYGYHSTPAETLFEYWYAEGSTALFSATPTSANYYVSGWSADSSNVYSTTRYMNSNYSITVNASLKTYFASYRNGNNEVAKVSYRCGTTYYYPSSSTYSSLRKTGYTLDGWTDNVAAQTKKWSPGQSFSNLSTTHNATVYRYAVWKANAYTVRFDGNDAEAGAMADQEFTYDSEQNLTNNSFTRKGWTFLGWSTSKTATTATYTDAQAVKNLTPTANGTVVLYAVWERSDFAFNVPDPVVANDLTASVSYDPSSPAPYGSTITAHVRLQGAPRASGVHLVSLKSDNLGLNDEIAVQVVRGSAVNEERVYTFTVPDHDTVDVRLGNSVAVLPDLYNQTFTYDGEPKPYLISSSIAGIELESVLYAKINSAELPTTDAPVDAGSYDVVITLKMREGGSSVQIAKLLTVRPKSLEWSVEQVTALDKEYDGSPEAVVEGTIAVDGVVAPDTGGVELARSEVSRGEFLSAACGVNKPVEADVSAVSLAGERAANYLLPNAPPPALYADITGLVPRVALGRAEGVVFNGRPQSAVSADGSPLVTFTDPNATSVVLNGAHEEQVTYTYYVDPGCVQKTTTAVGAADIGGPPAFAATYYVKATFTPGAGQEQYSPVESQAVPFTINRKTTVPAGVLDASWRDPLIDTHGVTYTGSELTPSVRVTDGVLTELAEGVDFEVSYTNNINVGQASARVVLKGNYEGTLPLTFDINHAIYSADALRATFPQVVTAAYDGLPHAVACDPYALLSIDTKLSVAYHYTGVDATTYDSDAPPVDVGAYDVTAVVTTANPNYRFPTSDGGSESEFHIKARLNIAYEKNTITFKLEGGQIQGDGQDVVWPEANRYTKLKDNYGGVPVPVKSGWELAGWESEGAVYVPSRAGEEEVRDERTYMAVWREADVNVTFEGNGGSFAGGAGQKTYAQPFMSSFDFAKIAKPAKVGAVFAGWAETKEKADAGEVTWRPEGGPGLEESFAFDAPAGKTYWAAWKEAEYTVTLFYNGGTANGQATQQFVIPYGQKIAEGGRAIDQPVLDPLGFQGWSDANASTLAVMSTEELGRQLVTGDVTYVAIWSGESVTTTFHAFDGAGSRASYTVPKVDKLSMLPIAHPVVTPPEGKKFSAWQVTESGDPSFSVGARYSDGQLFGNKKVLTGDVGFTAEFVDSSYTVSFEVNGGTVVAGETVQSVAHGDSPRKVAVERVGYTLESWLDVGMNETVSPQEVLMRPIAADTVYLAQWALDLKEVEFNANGGLATRTFEVQAGGTIDVSTVAEPRRLGFNFVGWASTKELADRRVADVTASGTPVRTVTADQVFWAVWSDETHLVTFQDDEGGTLAQGNVAFGQPLASVFGSEIAAPAREGKTFAGWLSVNTGALSPLEWRTVAAQVPQGDLVFRAAYDTVEHTLSFVAHPGSGGPAAQTRDWGTSLALADVAVPQPQPGFLFAGWYDGAQPEAARVETFDFTRDAVVYARYEATEVLFRVAYYLPAATSAPGAEGWTEVVVDTQMGEVGAAPAFVERAFDGYGLDAARTTYESSEHPEAVQSALSIAGDGSLLVKLYYAAAVYPIHYDTVAAGGAAKPADEPAYRAQDEGAFGKSVTLQSDLAAGGYTFGGWLFQGSYPPDFDPQHRTFTMPGRAVDLVGTWLPNNYYVRYDLAGGTGSFADTAAYHKGDRAPVQQGEPTRVGFAFGGWTDEAGAVYQPGESVTVNMADVRLTAMWTAEQYALRFETNGAPGIASLFGAAGDEVTLPKAPELAGREFLGWKSTEYGSVFAAESSYVIPAGNDTFVAQWRALDYRVTYDVAGGVGDIRDEAGYHAGDEVSVVAEVPTREGYRFGGWMRDGALVEGSFEMPVGDVTLTAVWQGLAGTLLYDLNGGVDPEGSFGHTTPIESGAQVVLPASAPTRDAAVFMGWADSTGRLWQPGENFVVPLLEAEGANVVLSARWTLSDDFGVTYDVAGGEGEVRDETRYRAGASVAIAGVLPTREGFTFGGWRSLADGVVYQPGGVATMPAANLVLVAVWNEINSYTVVFSGNGGEPNAQSVAGAAGSKQMCPAAPKRVGYEFAGWLAGDGRRYAAGAEFVMPEGNTVVMAQWKGIDAVVHFDAAGGAPTPKDVATKYGAVLVLPSAPTWDGRVMSGWSDGAGVYAAGASYPVQTDEVTLVAHWEPEGYTLSYDLDGGVFNVAAPGYYRFGDEFAFPEPSQADRTFEGWFVNGDKNSPKTGVSPDDATNLHLVAKWRVGTHVLALTAPAFDDFTEGNSPREGQPLRVTNEGTLDTDIVSVLSSSEAFVVSGSGAMVAAGSSIDTWLVKPAARLPEGDHTATITVTYRDVDGAQAHAETQVAVRVTKAPSEPTPNPEPTPTPNPEPVPEPPSAPKDEHDPPSSNGSTVTEYVYLSNGSIAGAAPESEGEQGEGDPQPSEPDVPAPEPSNKTNRTLAFKFAGGIMYLAEDAQQGLAVTFEPATWDVFGFPLEGWEFEGLVIDGEKANPNERGAYMLPSTGDHTLEIAFTRTGLNAFFHTWWEVAVVFAMVGAALHALVRALLRRCKTSRHGA